VHFVGGLALAKEKGEKWFEQRLKDRDMRLRGVAGHVVHCTKEVLLLMDSGQTQAYVPCMVNERPERDGRPQPIILGLNGIAALGITVTTAAGEPLVAPAFQEQKKVTELPKVTGQRVWRRRSDKERRRRSGVTGSAMTLAPADAGGDKSGKEGDRNQTCAMKTDSEAGPLTFHRTRPLTPVQEAHQSTKRQQGKDLKRPVNVDQKARKAAGAVSSDREARVKWRKRTGPDLNWNSAMTKKGGLHNKQVVSEIRDWRPMDGFGGDSCKD
jgi:hypothetical protein